MMDQIRVTVIATGFNGRKRQETMQFGAVDDERGYAARRSVVRAAAGGGSRHPGVPEEAVLLEVESSHRFGPCGDDGATSSPQGPSAFSVQNQAEPPQLTLRGLAALTGGTATRRVVPAPLEVLVQAPARARVAPAQGRAQAPVQGLAQAAGAGAGAGRAPRAGATGAAAGAGGAATGACGWGAGDGGGGA